MDAGRGWGYVGWEYCWEVDAERGGEESVDGAIAPVTTSQSQSPIPPGVASTAVCGEYTLMPSEASRRSVCCCVSLRVRDFSPRKMMGSTSEI